MNSITYYQFLRLSHTPTTLMNTLRDTCGSTSSPERDFVPETEYPSPNSTADSASLYNQSSEQAAASSGTESVMGRKFSEPNDTLSIHTRARHHPRLGSTQLQKTTLSSSQSAKSDAVDFKPSSWSRNSQAYSRHNLNKVSASGDDSLGPRNDSKEQTGDGSIRLRRDAEYERLGSWLHQLSELSKSHKPSRGSTWTAQYEDEIEKAVEKVRSIFKNCDSEAMGEESWHLKNALMQSAVMTSDEAIDFILANVPALEEEEELSISDIPAEEYKGKRILRLRRS